MRISSVEGNTQRLDGGAMFGNAPKALWSRWAPPDAQGRIPLACRCFLVETGDKRILIETGVGAFFPPELKERYGVVDEGHRLCTSLSERGLADSDIDVVVLSHLHFDHAGGLLSAHQDGQDPKLLFEKAKFLVSRSSWERAQAPHPRDRASFVEAISRRLAESGRLVVVDDDATGHEVLGPRIRLRTSNGHTPGMLLPVLEGDTETMVFCADLVPGVSWVHAPITMGYDRFPEKLIDEKTALYESLGDGTWLLFTHDPSVAAGRLGRDERGRYCVGSTKTSLDRYELAT